MNIYKISFYNLVMLVICFSFLSTNIYSQELIPLQLGNKWKYEQKTIYKNLIKKRDTVVSEVFDQSLFNEKQWFYLNEMGDTYIVRNDKFGRYWELNNRLKLQDGNFKEELIYRYIDHKDTQLYKIYEGRNECTKHNGTVGIQTNFGKIDCLKYTFNLLKEKGAFTKKIDIYIKPGIGIILLINYQKNGYILSYQLIDYKLN